MPISCSVPVVALEILKSALTQISLDSHRSVRELLLGSFEDSNSERDDNWVRVSVGPGNSSR